jgi:GNAT superfamily N-acetyltransferase
MNRIESTKVAGEVFMVETDAEIVSCFPVFKALRPHLEQGGFLAQVRRQQKVSYQILALKHDGVIKCVAGFRLAEFLAWGRVLYIDDLATLPGATSQGFAGALLDWLIGHRLRAPRRAPPLSAEGAAIELPSFDAGNQMRFLGCGRRA